MDVKLEYISRSAASPSPPSVSVRLLNSVNSLNLNDFPFYGSRLYSRHMAQEQWKKRSTPLFRTSHETAISFGRDFHLRALSSISMQTMPRREQKGTKERNWWSFWMFIALNGLSHGPLYLLTLLFFFGLYSSKRKLYFNKYTGTRKYFNTDYGKLVYLYYMCYIKHSKISLAL